MNQHGTQQGKVVFSSVVSSPQTCRPVANTSASSFDKGVQHEPIPRSVESAADHGDQSTQCVHQARVCAGTPLVRGGCARQSHSGGVASPGEAQQGVPRLHERPLRPERPHAADPEGDAGRAQGLCTEAPDQPCGQHQPWRPSSSPSSYRSGTPETVVSFGRHQGKTFQEVLQEDKQYLEWGLKEASSNASTGWQLDMGSVGRPPRLTVRF